MSKIKTETVDISDYWWLVENKSARKTRSGNRIEFSAKRLENLGDTNPKKMTKGIVRESTHAGNGCKQKNIYRNKESSLSLLIASQCLRRGWPPLDISFIILFLRTRTAWGVALKLFSKFSSHAVVLDWNSWQLNYVHVSVDIS